MEKFRRKRSEVACIADRNSGELLAPMEQIHRKGNRQVQLRRNLRKSASDSSSCSSGTTDEDLFESEFGWRSSERALGTPVKNLLAEEMVHEREYKRQSPGVVAKLMGLDGLPSQQAIYKKQKRPSENHSRRMISLEKTQRSGTFFEGQLSRRNSKEQLEFKDVFEVLDPAKQGREKLKLSEADMAFIQQKFMDAKRLSTDEKLQDSKEFHDTLEILDSNKDLLMKFLQKPDSLFSRHLLDLQGPFPHSNCSSSASRKSSDNRKNGRNGCDSKLEREAPRKNYSKSPQQRCDANNSSKSSKVLLEGKDEFALLPTRIVVLKPNLRKLQNAIDSTSCSSHDLRNHTEFPTTKGSKIDFPGKNRLPRHSSRESRQIAKEVTRKMRNSLSADPVDFPSFGFELNESELRTVNSRPSSSHSKESSVSREAKKRLSERWKMTHSSLDMGVVSRGSTLAEMLAIHDKETGPAHSNARTRDEGSSEKLSIGRPVRRFEPLGISSRDGWKGESIGKLTRSKSLPASSTAFESPKTRQLLNSPRADRYLFPEEEAFKHERKVNMKGISFQREGSVRRNSRSITKKSLSSRRRVTEANDFSLEFHTSQNQAQTHYGESGPYEKDLQVFESSASTVNSGSPDLERHGDKALSSDDEFLPELSTQLLHDKLTAEETCDAISDSSVHLHPEPSLESPATSKESDQPSPVSVLEPPFPDDLSSCSECFESLSADLHGLRMQLQLLKLESETCAEGSMLISSDEEDGEDMVQFSDDKGQCGAQEGWEFTYLIDVLIDSGLNDADPDMFMATWHSLDCPIDPLLFDELEKKQSDQTSQTRCERKLLFDQVNSGILYIHEQYNDPHPWVKSRVIRLSRRWIEDGIHEELCKLLVRQEKKGSKEDTMEKETEWEDYGEEIDSIGREIERMMIDEVVAVVVENLV